MPQPPRDLVADPAKLLREVVGDDPELGRLLAERDMLIQRMQEIAERSVDPLTGYDARRFPVEPLGERRAGDDRWAKRRDEGRSAAVRRILEARRGDAAAEADRWPELRERQRVETLEGARAEREAREAEARALDARIEQARQDLLAERWAARSTEPGEDWHALRERRTAAALAEARARTEQAAAREQALEGRIARGRAERPEDWSERREQRRARALELARRQAVEAAAAEQALDRRLARAREDRLRENRSAQDSGREPHWVPPSDRRDPDPLPPEPPRTLPPTAAERSLDERIARARLAEAPAVRPPPPPPRAESRPVRAERDDSDPRFLERHSKSRAEAPRTPPARDRQAQNPPKPVARAEPPARPSPRPELRARRAETFEQRLDRRRDSAAARKPALPDRIDRPSREPAADKPAKRPAPTPREALRAWEESRDRRALRPLAELRGPGSLPRPGERKPAAPADSFPRPRARPPEPWPARRREKDFEDEKGEGREEARKPQREKPTAPKGPSERSDDLDKRREQALERLKAKRSGEQLEERRRALSRDRLAMTRGRFGGRGR
jgi:hypothetical protein